MAGMQTFQAGTSLKLVPPVGLEQAVAEPSAPFISTTKTDKGQDLKNAFDMFNECRSS